MVTRLRWRDRQRRGVVVVPVEILWDDLDAMNDAGLVAWNEQDRNEIGLAVRHIVDEWREEQTGGAIGFALDGTRSNSQEAELLNSGHAAPPDSPAIENTGLEAATMKERDHAETYRRTIETVELEARLAALEKQ